MRKKVQKREKCALTATGMIHLSRHLKQPESRLGCQLLVCSAVYKQTEAI
jgi:hypothetical protein